MRTKPFGDRIAICLLLIMGGCRHASVQDDPNWPSPGPVDVASLPPITSVINHGTTDPDALLANRATSKPVSRPEGSSAAAPVVLGPVRKDHPAESPAAAASFATVSHSDTTAPQPQAAVPAPVRESAPPQAELATLPPPAPVTPASLPASAARDELVRPTQSVPGQESLPPSLPPQTEASLPTAVPSQPLPQTAPAPPSAPAVSQTNPGQKPVDQRVPGALPKEIDFEGLPDSAVSAGRVAARVGREIITVYDLNVALQEWVRDNVQPGMKIPRREELFIAKMVLGQMIDRILIVQEAHRLMKSEKQKEALFKQIDQVWQEQQIPPLLKKYKVDTPYELDQVLKKQGRSLEAARKEFMDDAVAHEFMGMKLGGKVHVSLVDMRRYYNENRQQFDRPAQLTWREIRIPVETGAEAQTQEEARAVLAQVRSHSDFATLAKRHGKGPTADQGGLWETSPGAFAVEEVNKALETLQPGQISDIVVTPKALFIVKLESRREAGPARFDEVQTEIRKKLAEVKLSQAAAGYLKDLRKSTIISTIFDDIPDPRAAAADGQLQRTSSISPQSATSNPPASSPVVPSPQGPPANALQGAPQAAAPETPLPNLNPAGPIPPKGFMGGQSVSPL
ncbi:hypothetical protein GC170_03780 [bacterium]|nr:hypothetical protein [bacterium]